jgi:hypothetical protein
MSDVTPPRIKNALDASLVEDAERGLSRPPDGPTFETAEVAQSFGETDGAAAVVAATPVSGLTSTGASGEKKRGGSGGPAAMSIDAMLTRLLDSEPGGQVLLSL